MITPFLRQVIIATSAQLAALSMGGSFGYPSVLLRQFKTKESILQPDLDMTTWIISTYALAGLPSIFMPNIMQIRGRKFAFIGSSLLLTIGWLSTSFASTTTALIIAQVFSGLGSNCVIVVNLMSLSEMLAPKYRSISLMMLGVSQCLGMTGVSAIGTFLNWQTVALIMTFPVLTALIMAIAWTESPFWLAYMGEHEKCEKTFVTLRGGEKEAMDELQALLRAQKNRERNVTGKSPVEQKFRNFLKKDFYIPIGYMFLILSNLYLSGTAALYIYSQHVMEEATGNLDAAFNGNVFRDVFLVIGTFITLALVKYYEPKSVLLLSTFGSVVFLFGCSLVTYLQKIDIVPANSLLFIYVYCLYCVFNYFGLTFLSCSLSVELMPVKHRGLGGFLFTIYSCTMQSISAKLFTFMIAYLNLWGTFLFFAVSGLLGGVFITVLVPRSKNRTLQEIEDYYNYGSYVKIEDANVVAPIIENEGTVTFTLDGIDIKLI